MQISVALKLKLGYALKAAKNVLVQNEIRKDITLSREITDENMPYWN